MQAFISRTVKTASTVAQTKAVQPSPTTPKAAPMTTGQRFLEKLMAALSGFPA